jgi:hypothetical protein
MYEESIRKPTKYCLKGGGGLREYNMEVNLFRI